MFLEGDIGFARRHSIALLDRVRNKELVGEAGSQTPTHVGTRSLHSGQGEKPSAFPPRPSGRNLVPTLVVGREPILPLP